MLKLFHSGTLFLVMVEWQRQQPNAYSHVPSAAIRSLFGTEVSSISSRGVGTTPNQIRKGSPSPIRPERTFYGGQERR